MLKGAQSVAGGLLVSVSPEKAEMLRGLLAKKGVRESVAVGRVIPDRMVKIQVRF
jgi:hypothetical protein